MRRRDFLKGITGSAAAWPLAARAQKLESTRRVGVLMGLAESDKNGRSWLATFRERLRELGWVEGRNVNFIQRWAAGDVEKGKEDATELIKLQPDVVFASTSLLVSATQPILRSIPVVFVQVSNPDSLGFVQSLAHPGGNMTGFTTLEFSMGGKWLELLKEIQPNISRVAVLENPENANHVGYFRAIESAGKNLDVQVTVADAHSENDIEPAFKSLSVQPNSGVIVPPDPLTLRLRKEIASLADRYRIPTIYAFRPFTADGGLIAYGVDNNDVYRRAASYVDRILRGEKPADLPVEASNKFVLSINLKAAKAIGLAVPPRLLARADEVIE